MIREEIKKIIKDSLTNLIKTGQIVKDFVDFDFWFETPQKIYGDFTVNIHKITERRDETHPIKGVIYEEMVNFSEDESGLIADEIKRHPDFKNFFENLKFKSPVFFNFYFIKKYLQKQIEEILREKEKFGQLDIGKSQKVNVEFISANPTGPLTLGNGRGGFCGDVLANILGKAGYKVEREYYINNVGEQIKKLGHSVIGDSEAVYKGPYIEDLRKRIEGNNPEEVGKKAAEIILEEMIKPSVKKMGIKFDTWFYESDLYKKGKADEILELLEKKNLTCKKENALWFKSSQFGDDKNRVLIKENGEKTYLASDFAYLKNKFKRGFNKLIYIWGADHFGYVNRIKAAAEALGYKKEQVNIIIMQMVRLMQKGKEVRMSKRTGTYITLDELIDEVGLDIARFFFLTRGPDTHLNFDLDLAKEQSEKNPVYYIQYAYARICSIFKKAAEKIETKNLKLLKESSELTLIKQLIKFPEIIEDTAKDYQIQRILQYGLELANSFHLFYRDCKVISEDKKLSQGRLALVSAVKIVLKDVLDLMGISAPEKM